MRFSYFLAFVPDGEKQSVEELTTAKRQKLPFRSPFRRDTTLLVRLCQDAAEAWWFGFHRSLHLSTTPSISSLARDRTVNLSQVNGLLRKSPPWNSWSLELMIITTASQSTFVRWGRLEGMRLGVWTDVIGPKTRRFFVTSGGVCMYIFVNLYVCEPASCVCQKSHFAR